MWQSLFNFRFDYWYTALLALVPAMVSFWMVIHVVRNLPKDALTVRFTVMLSVAGCWQFADVTKRLAATAETAMWWHFILGIPIIFVLPAIFHFVLVFVGREKLARHPLVLVLIYLPSMLSLSMNHSGVQANARYVEAGVWGFVRVLEGGGLRMFIAGYLSSLGLGVLLLLYPYIYRSRHDPLRYRQAQLMGIGITLPLLFGIFMQILLPRIFGIKQVPIASSVSLTFSIAGFIALTRFHLLELSTSFTAAKVLKEAEDIILVTSPESNLMYINPHGAKMLGIREEKYFTYSLSQFFPDEERYNEFRQQVWEPAYNGERCSHISSTMFSQDGQVFPVLLSASLMHLHKQTKPNLMLIARDSSALTKAQEDILKAKDEAIRANQAKSQFLANMSHELRTPLNAIIGYSEMLAEDFAHLEDTQHADDAGRITQSGRHLLMLINEILDLSKIEAGHVKLSPQNTDIYKLAQDVIATVSPMAEAQHNALLLDCDDTFAPVYVDPLRLRQILFNLLSNACKFTESGNIALRITSKQRSGRAGIQFVVEDNGIGMNQKHLDRLFEAFYQVDSSTTGKYKGTGLGLAICKQLSFFMGGMLTAQSELGQGSSFAFWLPTQNQQADAREETNNETPGCPSQ